MKNRQQVTAFIYDKRGRVLSIGKNSYVKTHPLQAHHANKVGLGDKLYLHMQKFMQLPVAKTYQKHIK